MNALKKISLTSGSSTTTISTTSLWRKAISLMCSSRLASLSATSKGLEPKWHIPHLGVLGFMSFLNSSEHHLTKSKVAHPYVQCAEGCATLDLVK